MGKGEIISGGAGGLYEVRLLLERSGVESELARLTAQIAALETRISGMEEGKEKERVRLQQNALKKRKRYLEDPLNMPADPIINSWCADHTQNLTGEIGTIEVPGERTGVNIQPGHGGNASYSQERDGQLQPSPAGTPAGVFYNLAMLPGWQKWKPTYRYGTITALNGDICSLELEPATSTAQGLNVNQSGNLAGVPIVYMDCNGEAFWVGAEVIVEFQDQDWNSPRVIGFKSNPAECEEAPTPVADGFVIRLRDGYGSIIDTTRSLTLKVYNSSKQWIWQAGKEFNPDNGCWTVHVPEVHQDPDGYWLTYTCSYDGTDVGSGAAVPTQYPYKYKNPDKWNLADKVELEFVGTDVIPFFRAVSSLSPYPPEVYPGFCPIIGLDENGTGLAEWNGTSYYFLAPDKDITRNMTVKSSVPYSVSASGSMGGEDYHFDQFFFADVYLYDGGEEVYWCNTAGMSCCVKSRYTNNGEAESFDFEAVGTGANGPSISGRDHSLKITNTTPHTITHVCPEGGDPGTFEGELKHAALASARFQLTASIA